mmetsp:Transcript_29325/g.55398  ORF Transcript_29325/g.55398 Transcript_29325/m.55398 type:complete len:349 (+) Transcript_29325:745-1791(+)
MKSNTASPLTLILPSTSASFLTCRVPVEMLLAFTSVSTARLVVVMPAEADKAAVKLASPMTFIVTKLAPPFEEMSPSQTMPLLVVIAPSIVAAPASVNPPETSMAPPMTAASVTARELAETAPPTESSVVLMTSASKSFTPLTVVVLSDLLSIAPVAVSSPSISTTVRDVASRTLTLALVAVNFSAFRSPSKSPSFAVTVSTVTTWALKSFAAVMVSAVTIPFLASIFPATLRSPPTSAQPPATMCSPVRVPDTVTSAAITEPTAVREPFEEISLAVTVVSVEIAPKASMVEATLSVLALSVSAMVASLDKREVAEVMSPEAVMVADLTSLVSMLSALTVPEDVKSLV